jgi:uncharacterized protein
MPRSALRIALDTNVLLAAFVARGLCADLLALLLRLQLDGKAQVMLSKPVMDEFKRHLKGKFKANPTQIQAALAALEPFELHAGSTQLNLQSVPDADDIVVLDAALSWPASHFVTGDKALWPLSPLYGMQIITPREAFALLHTAA